MITLATATAMATLTHQDADKLTPVKRAGGDIIGYTYRTAGGYGAVSDCGKTDTSPMPTRKDAVTLLRAMRRDTARTAKVRAATPKIDTLAALTAIDNAHRVAADPTATNADKANAYFGARNITDRI